MELGFFTDSRFLALLRFWESQRRGASLPPWSDAAIASFPAEIASWLVAARLDGKGGARYFYAGAACVSRLGADPTGLRVDEFLAGAVLRYVTDIQETARRHGAPIFSYCLYHVGGDKPIRTARLFAPFSPDVMLALQLFDPTESPLLHYARRGEFEEIVRKRIRAGEEPLRSLEQAARFHRLARAVHPRSLGDDLIVAARSFDAAATVSLPVLRAVPQAIGCGKKQKGGRP